MLTQLVYRLLALAVLCAAASGSASAEERCRRADGVGVPCSWLSKQEQKSQRQRQSSGQSATSVKPEARETSWQPEAGETVLFAADWCPYCRAARAYLGERGIEYTEYNIETRKGRNAFREAGGGGIPLLVVDSRSIREYSEAAYDSFFRRKKK